MPDPLLRRVLLLCLLAAASVVPVSAHTQQIRVGNTADSVSRVVPRMSPQQARHAITTEDGRIALLLGERGVVLQFTDHGLDDAIASGKKEEEEPGVFAQLIGGLVRGSVRTLLNHGIEYPLSALADARYEDGRLHFVRIDGGPAFENVRVNEVEVMEAFRPRDARAFVARFREAKARGTL